MIKFMQADDDTVSEELPGWPQVGHTDNHRIYPDFRHMQNKTTPKQNYLQYILQRLEEEKEEGEEKERKDKTKNPDKN